MANYITTDTELTSIANAIRTKGGTSMSLTYPSGFISAIEDISTTPKLQVKEVIAENMTETYLPGSIIIASMSYNLATGQHASASSHGLTVAKTQIVDTSKKYNLFGLVKIIDTNDEIIETIPIGFVVDPTTDDAQRLYITSDYITEIKLINVMTTNSFYAYCAYNSGTFGMILNTYLIENNEEYEGLQAIKVNLDGKYGLYRCLTIRSQPLRANGSSTYGYTAEDVSNWCDSFYNTFSNNQGAGNIQYRQFEGINFSGSFYFNNITFLSSYTFARAWTGNGISDTGNADLYFPQVSFISDHVFYMNGNIRYISAPNCIYISGRTFLSCTKMSSIDFPLCQSIYSSAFQECTGLISANFPECTLIGTSVFSGCMKLQDISFPKCSSISNSAFYLCRSLTTVSFPVCTTISNGVFMGCSSLNTANFPECTLIGSYAFSDCACLTTINFPKCSWIGNYCFQRCYSLTQASFPSCTVINSYAFQSCSSLTSVYLPICTFINSGAFHSCIQLESIDLPECSSFGTYVFSNCTAINNVSVPKLEIVGQYAFHKCINLSTISLPACTDISQGAFSSCTHLLSLYLMGSSYVSLAATGAFNYTPISTYTTSTNGVSGSIYVPASMLNTYKTMTVWTYFSSRMVGI